MQFNGETNKQDVVSSVHFICKTDENSYTINDITRNANIWYHKAIGIIQGIDGVWQYDDSNNTTLPIATTDLVNSQKDYSIDDELLEIERLEIKDTNGNWSKLSVIDIKEIDGAIDEYKKTDGIPTEYDVQGKSIFLYPATNYNSTDGMKIYFKRSANIFDVTDTTKEAGFTDRFHEYIIKGTALEYSRYYKPELAQTLEFELSKIESEMKKFYGRRKGDRVQRLVGAYINTK